MINRALLAIFVFGLSIGACPAAPQADDDLCYVLQPDAVSLQQLVDAAFHWLILEPSREGDAASEFTAAEISQIRTNGPCRKLVLAYLSIGEAEDYRDYFDPSWVDDNGDPIPGVAPDWLGPTNPDWFGNYKVRYWDGDWQDLLFGTTAGPDKTPLDRILDAGFDGVYLDIVDAYEFWSSSAGGNELTRMQARTRMIDLVEAIANHARQTRGVPQFMVFPQNASDIIRNDDYEFDADTQRYFAAISGIGQEDLYYDELTAQPQEDVTYVLEQLREYHARGKTVLVTDYVFNQSNPTPAANDIRVLDFYTKARAEGFVPYAAHRNRDLNEIVTFSTAGGWSLSQPTPGCVSVALGDMDLDGDVDLFDAGLFAICLAGPGILNPPPRCRQPLFDRADHTGDLAVDLRDLVTFQLAMLYIF